jgi:DNA-binding MarR family transcriptional regulator
MNSDTQHKPQTLLADIHRLYSSAFYHKLRDEGIDLSRIQWRAIAILKFNNGITQSELAERLLMDKAPMGALLDKLEAKQLIQRRTDAKDRRAKRIHLTQATEPLIPILERHSDTLLQRAVEGLSELEIHTLETLLTKMRNNLTVKHNNREDT